MMGGETPETCWAVNKRQDNKLENCCIYLLIYLNSVEKSEAMAVLKGAVHLQRCTEGCSPLTALYKPQHSNLNMRFSLPCTCLQNSVICFSNFVVHSFVEVLRFPLIRVFSPKCDASVRFPPVLRVARVSLQQQQQQQTALTTAQTSLTVPRLLETDLWRSRRGVPSRCMAGTALCLLALVYEFPATNYLWPPHHLCPLY